MGLQNGGGTAIDQNFDGENRGHEDVVSDDFGVSCFQTNQPHFWSAIDIVVAIRCNSIHMYSSI